MRCIIVCQVHLAEITKEETINFHSFHSPTLTYFNHFHFYGSYWFPKISFWHERLVYSTSSRRVTNWWFRWHRLRYFCRNHTNWVRTMKLMKTISNAIKWKHAFTQCDKHRITMCSSTPITSTFAKSDEWDVRLHYLQWQ